MKRFMVDENAQWFGGSRKERLFARGLTKLLERVWIVKGIPNYEQPMLTPFHTLSEDATLPDHYPTTTSPFYTFFTKFLAL